MVACVLIPRFSLRVAGGDRREACALAPVAGAAQVVGEVSEVAEAQGVRAGMALAEALARSPELRLVAPDPDGAARRWEEVLAGLEGIGAAVESERAGEAFFAVDGLEGIHGGLAGVLTAARRAVSISVRIGVAPTRFASFLAAGARSARGGEGEPIVEEPELAEFLAPFPVSTLAPRLGVPLAEARKLVESLWRLGIRTLGALADLRRDQLADRFGALGLRALDLVEGIEAPLRPRHPTEELAERIELPDAIAGEQLEHALELLVDRLLAAPARRGRTLLALRLGAALSGGGSWSAELTMGGPSASPEGLCRQLAPKLADLPGPADSLSLRALSFGPRVGHQLELTERGAEQRRARLATALGELRATQGADVLLRAIDADSRSRLPERRALLAPLPEP
jgi:nucleotidyltransferase/DNA polymerase involved in DNA repair